MARKQRSRPQTGDQGHTWLDEKEREPPYQPKFHKCIPLATIRDVDTEMGSLNDPMVIRMNIANFTVHKVLVDNGSSADIIFKDVLRKIGLDEARLDPVQTRLVGFGGSEVTSLGTVKLLVSIGEEPKRKTTMVKFLLVDTSFAYNVLLGQPGLNAFKAIVSTYHLKMKFPTKNGVGEVSCDQREARRCYNLSLRKGDQEERKRKIESEMEESSNQKTSKID
ncbi:UNVERIFIED_CONTAM: hypothetical protein Slati_4238700 [Sesamum latifolium]|uniref:Peptidase A2 domain-containing protein n=1 Tax=Sesamum latifolium TaxID=2727402 RepID=A0AAW2TB96_9LAMI